MVRLTEKFSSSNILPVLLSAGMGTRLLRENNGLPKALLKFNEEYLITFQLRLLNQFGFKEAVIITGYKSLEVRRSIGDNFEGMALKYINNNEFAQTGTAYSFFRVKEFWSKNPRPILLLHADLFYDTSIIDNLLGEQFDSTIVTDYDFQTKTNDEMVVFADKSQVIRISKGPGNFKGAVGESLGISLFGSDFCQKYFLFLLAFFKDRFNQQTHWEQTIQEFLLNNKEVILFHKGIENKFWINVNDSDDLRTARQEMHKKLNG